MNVESRPGAAIENSAVGRVQNQDTGTLPQGFGSAIQPMPELSADAYAALREEIIENGVITPVVIDQYGRGFLTGTTAESLGIHCPRRRAARRIRRGCGGPCRHAELRSPSTVGAVRHGQVSKLDTRRDAEATTAEIREHVVAFTAQLQAIVGFVLSKGVEPTIVARALLAQRRLFERDEAMAPLSTIVFDPIVDEVLDPQTVDVWRPHFEHPTFKLMSADEVDILLATLRGEEVRHG